VVENRRHSEENSSWEGRDFVSTNRITEQRIELIKHYQKRGGEGWEGYLLSVHLGSDVPDLVLGVKKRTIPFF